MNNIARHLELGLIPKRNSFACSMYGSDNGQIEDSVKSLQLQKRNRVLEIGPGNGEHLPLVLGQAREVKYFGLDVSKFMVHDALKLNKSDIAKRNALFAEYDGEHIPYVHNLFDRVLTINTIYFWHKPVQFLNEIHRVLKPGGICVISFVEEKSMVDKGYTNESFELYDISKVVQLIAKSAFKNVDVKTISYDPSDGAKNTDLKEYILVTLQKKPKEKNQQDSEIAQFQIL